MSIVAPRRILNVPLHRYDVLAQDYVDSRPYVASPKSELGNWYQLMLKAQNSGRRLATSAEWFLSRAYLQANRSEEEADFINGPLEWTGTVLDSEREELLEGIELNPDESIKSVNARLGRKEGIVLPGKSAYVKDLGDDHMPLAKHLWGVQDPKRELPDYAYLSIQPGLRPVVRGRWPHRRDDGRVDAYANYEASDGRFASRFVSETRPENLITPAEYNTLEQERDAKKAELESELAIKLKHLQDKVDAAVGCGTKIKPSP